MPDSNRKNALIQPICPMFNLDLDNIAVSSGLRPESVSWRDDDVPLHARGISIEWLGRFAEAVKSEWDGVKQRHEFQRRATVYSDMPEPGPLPFPEDQEITSAFLVRNIIQPMTTSLAAPLYARVPDAFRGRPQMFISHAWK